MKNYFILMVEDHYELASTTCDFLEDHDFVVDHARTLDSAKHLLKQNHYHLLLLDINLPDGSGYALCQWLRHDVAISIPVLMLTARDTLDDKLLGFESGTDDYVIKPFDFNELIARIKALIKRAHGEVSQTKLQVADLILDSNLQTVTRSGQSIELPPIQFKLLKFLMRNSPNVISKQEIMMELWGDEEPESDALRSHIYNLRKMIDKPFEKKLIHTISGVGLQLTSEG